MNRKPISLIAIYVLAHLSYNGFAQPVLSLNDAIQQALQKNYDLQLVQQNEEIAQVQNNWGNAGRLPVVNGNAGYTVSSSNVYQKLNTGTVIERNGALLQNQNAAINASWRLYNGGRVTAAKKRLDAQEQMAGIAIKQQANQTVYNVISGYLGLMRLKQQKLALEQTQELFKERMKLAENRFKIGVADKSDFLQAQVDYNQQQNLLLNNELDTKQSISYLNNLMVRDANELFTTEEQIAQVSIPARSAIISSIDTLSPALLLAKSQELVLMQQYKEIRAQLLPTLSLNGGASLNNSNNTAGQLLRNTSYGPTAGITMSIPIYQAGIVKQQLKVNQILQHAQRLQYDQIKNDLQTSLANAFNSAENSGRQYELEIRNLALVKENSAIAMERFRKGSITTVELRQSQLNLIESQTRMINAQYQMRQAETDILLLMGKLIQ